MSTATATTATETGCKQCGSTEPWGRSSWCPRCGYYPAIGACVDAVAAETAKSAEAPDTRATWQRIPRWAYVLAGGVIAVWVISMVGRFVTTDGGPWRCVWAIAEIVIGLTLFTVGHTAAYLYAAIKSEKLGPMAVVFNPIELWEWTFRILPKSVWRLWLAAWGATGVVCGLTIVGGISYSALFEKDWGFKQPAKKSVVAAIVEQARNAKGGEKKSMEEAMDDFVGKAGAQITPPPKKAEKLESAECLIVGYTKLRTGELDLLLIASVVDDKLQFVGTMKTENIPAETRQELLTRFKGLERERPFVKNPLIATWVEPKLMCAVEYKDLTDNKRFRDPTFKALLGDVSAQ